MDNSEQLIRQQTYVSLREYQERDKSGWFIELSRMTTAEKVRRFGAEFAPICGPLLPGETVEDYENQFADWLWSTQKLSVDYLKRQSAMRERCNRIQFARKKYRDGIRDQNRKRSPSRLRPRSRSRSPSPSRSRSRSQSSSRGALAGTDARQAKKSRVDDRTAAESSLAAYPTHALPTSEAAHPIEVKPELEADCGNGASPSAANELVTTSTVTPQPSELSERSTRSAPSPPIPVDGAKNAKETAASLTSFALSGGTANELTQQLCESWKSIGHDATSRDDPVEEQLWSEYDAAHIRVLLEEATLDNSRDNLLHKLANTDQVQQIQDTLRVLQARVQSSIETRTVTVALLVAYLWRNDVDELKTLSEEAATRDSETVQRVSHKKCADCGQSIAAKQREVLVVTKDLDAAASSTSDANEEDMEWMERIATLSDKQTAGEQEIREQRDKRRCELKMLLRFDQRLRLAVREVLKKATA